VNSSEFSYTEALKEHLMGLNRKFSLDGACFVLGLLVQINARVVMQKTNCLRSRFKGSTVRPLFIAGFVVKTTLVLSDGLIERCKRIQRRDKVSFNALVEEGLGLALEKREVERSQFKFQPVFGGKGWLTEEAERAGGLAALLIEVNQR
jgi:hypothetical protein